MHSNELTVLGYLTETKAQNAFFIHISMQKTIGFSLLLKFLFCR